jgi:hypothetical protein
LVTVCRDWSSEFVNERDSLNEKTKTVLKNKFFDNSENVTVLVVDNVRLAYDLVQEGLFIYRKKSKFQSNS